MRNRKVELSLNPCKLKGDRGNRTPRSAMFFHLFAMVWAPIFAFFKFCAIFGLVVGAGTIFGGVLLGVGGLVLVGWFVVNLVMDNSMWGNKDYQRFRANGGDPYFDWTWFWPLNNDSEAVRNGGGYLLCPNPQCGREFPPQRVCPHCNMAHMDFLRCGACGRGIFDPNRDYDQQSGIQCQSCGLISRSPSLAHLPVIQPALPPPIPSRSSA